MAVLLYGLTVSREKGSVVFVDPWLVPEPSRFSLLQCKMADSLCKGDSQDSVGKIREV